MMRPSLLYLLLGLSLVATKCTYDHGQRQAGILSERLRVTDSVNVVLQRRTKTVDSAYRKDTVALNAALARYAAARQELSRRMATSSVSEKVVHISDTVVLERVAVYTTDTLEVPVEVVKWVVAEADSTIQACRSVVQTCEQRVALRDSSISTLSRQLQLERKQRPSGLKKWAERAGWAGLVLLVSR